MHQDLIPAESPQESTPLDLPAFKQFLADFKDFGEATRMEALTVATNDTEATCPVYINEFWTAKQRDAHRLHEVSYRACFKAQLPRFFIQHLTSSGETIYDPFMGRGTTLLEAVLMGRRPAGNDINPLSQRLISPRLNPPTQEEVIQRLGQIDLTSKVDIWEELLVFYHPDTLHELTNLKHYFLEREQDGSLNHVDQWIRMVAINRLTGHSSGFFSVYSLPPNQAVSIKSQIRINERRNQTPDRRIIKDLIAKKSAQLLKTISTDERQIIHTAGQGMLMTGSAHQTPDLSDASVDLVVTSPPFLNIVNYSTDNWLRCWFTGIDAQEIEIMMSGSNKRWTAFMADVFQELARVLKPSGHIAFEVGEVRKGKVRLEESVIQAAVQSGLHPELVLINAQEFTKTANCWGVDNNDKGTNTNRIVLLRKSA